METRHIGTLNELSDIARVVFLECVKKDTAVVIALQGDLGAGKTAFTKELARHFKIQNEITSPTFVIMKSYAIPNHAHFKTLTHIDAYRIEADDEMRVLGFDELLKDRTRVICIEWPEKIQNLIPNDAYNVTLLLNNDGTREISYGR